MIYILIYGRATWMKVQYSQLCLILKNQSNYCIAVQLSWSFHIALSPSSEFCLMLHRSAAEQPLNHFESAMDYCNGYLSEISVGLLVLLREKKASRYYRSTRKLTQFVWGPIKSSGMGSHVCFFPPFFWLYKVHCNGRALLCVIVHMPLLGLMKFDISGCA